MNRLIAIPAAAAVVTTVTVLNRLRVIPLDELAATPRAVENGRVWLLLTSALVADRPAVPSIVGFVVVGVAAVALLGSRVTWTAAILGHVLATVVVYAALAAASYRVARADFGTSAMIAAWIGAIAYHVHRRGRGAWALGLCVVSGLVGWFFRPDLDVLDTEHLVALAVGAAVAAGSSRLDDVARRLSGHAARHGRRAVLDATGARRHRARSSGGNRSDADLGRGRP